MPPPGAPGAPADTSPEAWRVHLSAIAHRSVAERLEEWAALNRELGRMEAAWVRRRHPDYCERQVFMALVRRRYGDEMFRAAWPDEALIDP